MNNNEAITLAIEGIEKCAKRILEEGADQDTIVFNVYLALGYISSVLTIYSVAIETLKAESEARK